MSSATNKQIPIHRIVMVGSGSVGKSALTLQFMYNEFVEDYEPTKVDTYSKKLIINGQEVHISILDTAGQEDYAGIRENFFRDSEGFMCVFSLNDRSSFEEIEQFRNEIIRVKGSVDLPMLIIANKVDLVEEREVSREEITQRCSDWQVECMETSAKTCENVDRAFGALVQKISTTVVTVAEDVPEKSCCCLMQ